MARVLDLANLANLVNLAKVIRKFKCKYRHDDKKCEYCGIRYRDCECHSEYTNITDNLRESKCLCHNNNL